MLIQFESKGIKKIRDLKKDFPKFLKILVTRPFCSPETQESKGKTVFEN